MTTVPSFASRISALALLSLALLTPAAAQEGAQDGYDALFQAYFDGEAMDTLPEYQARLLLVDHIAQIMKNDPELKGWTDADTRDAITAFGTPARVPYKQRVADRLRAAIQPARARAATELAADPAALATIKCVARRTSRAASEWAVCATKDGRTFTEAEQALGTEALETVNAVVNQPDLNSAVVGIICHTLDRFGDRMSGDGMTRKYSMTISLISAEEPLACDRAKPRYAALVGHDSYLKLEPALHFESEKEGE